jgi:site-specific DNA-methyltransferase (adenine-specific)
MSTATDNERSEAGGWSAATCSAFVDSVLNGDCLEIMRGMPDGCIDAVITDPPYCSGSVSEASRTAAKGQGLRSENIQRMGWFVGDNMGTAGLVWLIRSMAVEALRLLKGQGSMLIFCDWRMVPNLIPAVESAGFRYQNLVVWDKTHMGLGTGFRARHELIMHMTAGSPEYHDKGTANVLQCNRVTAAEREHQTQKPVDLIAQLCRVVCPPGGTILDPFAGSGTLAEAARANHRHFVCIERDADHCETAEARINGTTPDLFGQNAPAPTSEL